MPWKTISVLDPALEHARMRTDDGTFVDDVRQYISTRDLDWLVPKYVRTSERPAVFELRDIPNTRITSYVMQGSSDEEKFQRAFVVAVERVDDLVRATDGRAFSVFEPSGTMRWADGERAICTDAELDYFPYTVIQEIGSAALTRSFLPRASVAGYQLPHISAYMLGTLVLRSADASPSTAVPSSEEDTPQAERAFVRRSEQPMAATAEAP